MTTTIYPIDLSSSAKELVPNLLYSIWNNDDLTVAQIPISEVNRFYDYLNQGEAINLPIKEKYKLAQQILSLFSFPPRPEIKTNVPIKLDVLTKKIANQPLQFLESFLCQVSDWFGISQDSIITKSWIACLANGKKDYAPPGILGLLYEKQAVAISEDVIWIPASLLVSLVMHPKGSEIETVSLFLHSLRNYLTININKSKVYPEYFQDLVNYLLNPTPSIEGHKYRLTRSRGELVDVVNTDLESLVDSAIPILVDGVLNCLQDQFGKDRAKYRELINHLHGSIWLSIFNAIKELQKIEDSLPTHPILVDSDDWITSCRLTSDGLQSISDAYSVLTKVEESLGIDRYLGSKVLSADLKNIHQRVRVIGQRVQSCLESSRGSFLSKWNLTEITPLLLGLLGDIENGSKILPYFRKEQNRVIFILVDGLGFTQFQWLLKIVAQHPISQLGSNIFSWLNDRRYFESTYLLASNFISVTGGCLPTIFTGALPKETGIIGSHMLIGNEVINILKGKSLRNSNLKTKEITDLFNQHTNQKISSISEIAIRDHIETTILHGGLANFHPFTKYTYGKVINNPNKYKAVNPADRVFSEAISTFQGWEKTDNQKRLLLIYYPNIDSSGHPCGPYTQFQASELARFNFLFTHFLIDMAEMYPYFFDGKTSIVVTADHGMFESSSLAVNEELIRKAAKGLISDNATFVYENRACYIYGIEKDIEQLRNNISESFRDSNYPIAVYSRNDKIVEELLCDPKSPFNGNCPDLILQFYSDGVFFHKSNLEVHEFLYGAHGGSSVEETFVPLININLVSSLRSELIQFYK